MSVSTPMQAACLLRLKYKALQCRKLSSKQIWTQMWSLLGKFLVASRNSGRSSTGGGKGGSKGSAKSNSEIAIWEDKNKYDVKSCAWGSGVHFNKRVSGIVAEERVFVYEAWFTCVVELRTCAYSVKPKIQIVLPKISQKQHMRQVLRCCSRSNCATRAAAHSLRAILFFFFFFFIMRTL